MFLHQIQNINIQLTQRVDISNRDVEIDTTIDVESLLTYDTLTPDDSLKDKNIQSGKPAKDCINTEKRMLFDSASENNYMETSVEIKTYIEKTCDQKILDRCIAKLKGKLQVNTSTVSMMQLKNMNILSSVQNGGWWQPKLCLAKRKVAIIIPYKDREEHLAIFLRHLHPILQRQKLHYRIFAVEQEDEYKFNRGKLLNVGFREALKFFPYDCFVFHDVDLLPEDDRNTYDCSSSPQHLCVALDKFEYKLLYDELFGGVEMFTQEHFKLVNGFSNSFWGWGAEDDNLYKRLTWKGLQLWRPSTQYARYKMLKHVDKEASADPERFTKREESYKHLVTDGLVNLQYDIKEIQELPFYTLIKVNLRKDKDKMFGIKDFPSN